MLRRRARRTSQPRDWFERLTGFAEHGYTSTRRMLQVEGDQLISRVNGKRFGIGELTLPTLAELRKRVNPARGHRSSLGGLIGDARTLHRDPQFEGALFQVASQFNVLEMMTEDVTPEQGVTDYALDHTQGPACAIAAGAATIYRNYFVPVGDGVGQTADRQIDTLAGLGGHLAIGLNRNVEVTDADAGGCQRALRSLKRRLVRVVFSRLRADQPDADPQVASGGRAAK